MHKVVRNETRFPHVFIHALSSFLKTCAFVGFRNGFLRRRHLLSDITLKKGIKPEKSEFTFRTNRVGPISGAWKRGRLLYRNAASICVGLDSILIFPWESRTLPEALFPVHCPAFFDADPLERTVHLPLSCTESRITKSSSSITSPLPSVRNMIRL